jgi:hypothetical protein
MGKQHRTMRHKPFPFAAFLFAIALPVLLNAQTDTLPMHTLIGSGSGRSNGGWGGLSAHYTRVMGQDALLTGVRGGWIIDHRVTLGFAGFGLVTDVPNTAYDSHLAEEGIFVRHTSQFRMGYGGLLIEPVIAYRSAIHVTLPVIIGAGGAVYETYESRLGRPNGPTRYNTGDAQAFFVIEPGIALELSMIKLVRLGLGVSYRYTSDITLPETPKDALRGFNAGVTLKIGRF